MDGSVRSGEVSGEDNPQELFEHMLTRWRVSMVQAHLRQELITRRVATVQRFAIAADAYPWSWRKEHLSRWLARMTEQHFTEKVIHERVFGLWRFLTFASNPINGVAQLSEARYGLAVRQIVEGNTPPLPRGRFSSNQPPSDDIA